ncbi:MAG: acyl-CoA dehydrogenase [Candidatus Aminicenantes bacterium RBG_16_63_16]|nr:MAG: acyl-CoA dehydrogenase [Candidatus Aminicenantes bacterium RBG_16_63_16]
MDFELNEDQKMIQETIRKFAKERIAPVAAENDKKARFPMDLFRELAGLGFMGTPIPVEYGGAGFDYLSHALVAEEIGRVDSSLRGTYSVQVSLVELPLYHFGTEDQKKKYLPKLAAGEWIGCFGLTEPGAGSDPVGMTATAKEEGGHYILNGQKTWITNAGIADLAIVYAKTQPDAGAQGITAFLVERGTEGYSTRDIHDKLGLRASNTGEIFLENCRVPKENILGEKNKGFKVALNTLDFGRFTVAAGCVGLAQGCIDASKDYARARVQFGKPIASFQLVQQMIADMVVDCEAGRLLVYRVGDMKNKGLPNTRETSIAKYFCGEMVNRVAYKAIQVHGGYGFSGEYNVERFYRDARINTLYEGTSQIQQLIIGSYELGIRAFV